MPKVSALAAAVAVMSLCSGVHAAPMDDGVSAFAIALADYCVPSVANRRPLDASRQSRRAGIIPADPQARQMLHAQDSQAAWAVVPGNDAVFILENAVGDCTVTALGPPLATTFDFAKRTLTGPPLKMREGQLASPPTSILMHFELPLGTEVVSVDLAGSEPGMPDHRSKLSSLYAKVSRYLRASPPSA